MKKSSLNVLSLAVMFGLSLSLPVFAAHEDACKDDKAKFCSSVDQTDRKAVWACLKKNEDQVSDACKTQMSKHHGKKSSTSQSTTGTTPAPATGTAAQ